MPGSIVSPPDTLRFIGIHRIQHAAGAPALRLLGSGPSLFPTKGLLKLQHLLRNYAFWAGNRSIPELRHMLKGSNAVVTLWQEKRLVGFGRATSDGVYRAALWDVVVAGDLQGHGLGRIVVETLLEAPALKNVERVYLMTTNSAGFYIQLGFRFASNQQLLVRKNK